MMSAGQSPGLSLSNFPTHIAVMLLSSKPTHRALRVKSLGSKDGEMPDTGDVGVGCYSHK